MLNKLSLTKQDKRVKRLRRLAGKMRELGISNRHIAARCHVSDPMVSMVINGKATAAHILRAIEEEIAKGKIRGGTPCNPEMNIPSDLTSPKTPG